MRVLRQIHARVLTCFLPVPTFTFLLSKILSFSALSPLGNIDYAGKVFAQIPGPGIYTYNSIIRGFLMTKNHSREPLYLYISLVRRGYPTPNTFTMAFVLKACSVAMAFVEGRQVHGHVLRYGFGLNPFVQTSLLNLYAKCEQISIARKVFDEISERSVVSWSAMISGYARMGMVNEALGMFRDMQKAGIQPDVVSLGTVISACAMVGALDIGRWVHAYIEKQKIDIDLELGTALVNFYAKCGFIEKAKEIFDRIPVKDSKAWNSMLVGFSIFGLAEDALKVFHMMDQAKAKPNHLTFIGILSACAHGGLISEGRKYWSHMLELGIEPSMEHYSCMVDLFCRGGLVEEAYHFVESIPISPDPVIWRTLLIGCRKRGFVQQAEIVAQRLLQVEPENAENYIILANMYASELQWEKMRQVRKSMKEKGLRGVPGSTSIEVDGFVHEFVMGDRSHPEAKEIRTTLREVSVRVHKSGHEPSISAVLHQVDDEEKEDLSIVRD